MLAGEVLVRELLAVDGLATSALYICKLLSSCGGRMVSYVSTSEVTTLKHELRNNTVEGRTRVSEALLAGAKSTEVLGSLRDYIVVEDEVDATRLLCRVSGQLCQGKEGWG